MFGKIVSVNMLCVPRERQMNLVAAEIKSPQDDWRGVPPQYA